MFPRLLVAEGKLQNGEWWDFTALLKLGAATTLKTTAGAINLNFGGEKE